MKIELTDEEEQILFIVAMWGKEALSDRYLSWNGLKAGANGQKTFSDYAEASALMSKLTKQRTPR